MFDTVDAAFYYPPTEHAYFFKGQHYLKYRRGHGVVLLSGRELRTIGVDGWTTFPDFFKQDIDAALFYPPNGHAYFFKQDKYIKYLSGEGVVPLANGELIRTIGVDGWKSFPKSFKSDIDATLFYPANGHAYFFKGDRYIKFLPGSGVVLLHSHKRRTIGTDGWNSFPESFTTDLDAAMEYTPLGKVYFFKGREYLRWEPGEGVDARYPRRLGLLHSNRGGWPGLSHVVAGPLVGRVTSNSARIWIWMTDTASVEALQVIMNNSVVAFTSADPVGPEVVGALDDINGESQIRVLGLGGLSPETSYEARIMLGETELDTVTFTTAPAPSSSGTVKFVFGSCSDMSKYADVRAFEAMNNARPDFALFCGDNCYYVHDELATGAGGPRPRDWESSSTMLRRQIEARNHPQFTRLSRSVPLYSTWDDHDFGYNNAHGADLTDDWVGREVAAAVFRAMWPNPYRTPNSDRSIFYAFRWGPIEVFMTDSRFDRDPEAQVIWGEAQREWLVARLAESTAPLKIVVVSGQFLFTHGDEEGHSREAVKERNAVVSAVLGVTHGASSVSGRVLFLSGDVHYSELVRQPESGPADLVEFTSSPIRRDVSGDARSPALLGTRIWAAKQDGFGIVTVDIQSTGANGEVNGTVTLEARNQFGNLMVGGGQTCQSTWDLASGTIT